MLEKLKATPSGNISDSYVRLSVNEFRSNLADAFRYTTLNNDLIVLTKNGEERVGLVPLEYIKFVDDLNKQFAPETGKDRVSLQEMKAIIDSLLENREVRGKKLGTSYGKGGGAK